MDTEHKLIEGSTTTLRMECEGKTILITIDTPGTGRVAEAALKQIQGRVGDALENFTSDYRAMHRQNQAVMMCMRQAMVDGGSDVTRYISKALMDWKV